MAMKVPDWLSQRFHCSCGALFFRLSTFCQRIASRMSSLPVRS
jgi:hypothetical protein